MTLTKRVVVCLDVLDGRVVKGTRFVNLRDIGDPVALAERYERDGADEIVFLDIGATPNQRETILALAQQAAERLFIPLTIGGGIRSVEDMAMALRAGADKVSVNSAAITDPELLSQAAARFGSRKSNNASHDPEPRPSCHAMPRAFSHVSPPLSLQ